MIDPLAAFVHQHENVAVSLARREETIGDYDGLDSSAEDILRDN